MLMVLKTQLKLLINLNLSLGTEKAYTSPESKITEEWNLFTGTYIKNYTETMLFRTIKNKLENPSLASHKETWSSPWTQL